MPLTTLALTAELPRLGESLTWSQLEAWAVAMREVNRPGFSGGLVLPGGPR